jgi:hypothetical protein
MKKRAKSRCSLGFRLLLSLEVSKNSRFELSYTNHHFHPDNPKYLDETVSCCMNELSNVPRACCSWLNRVEVGLDGEETGADDEAYGERGCSEIALGAYPEKAEGDDAGGVRDGVGGALGEGIEANEAVKIVLTISVSNFSQAVLSLTLLLSNSTAYLLGLELDRAILSMSSTVAEAATISLYSSKTV